MTKKPRWMRFATRDELAVIACEEAAYRAASVTRAAAARARRKIVQRVTKRMLRSTKS